MDENMDGTLQSDIKHSADNHLSNCYNCREALAQQNALTGSVSNLMSRTTGVLALRPDLQASIMSAVDDGLPFSPHHELMKLFGSRSPGARGSALGKYGVHELVYPGIESGETWRAWNKQFSFELVKKQTVVAKSIKDPTGKMVDIGYWKPATGREWCSSYVYNHLLRAYAPGLLSLPADLPEAGNYYCRRCPRTTGYCCRRRSRYQCAVVASTPCRITNILMNRVDSRAENAGLLNSPGNRAVSPRLNIRLLFCEEHFSSVYFHPQSRGISTESMTTGLFPSPTSRSTSHALIRSFFGVTSIVMK